MYSRTGFARSRDDGEFDEPRAALEDRHGLLVRHVLQREAVHREDLVSALQPSVRRGRALCVYKEAIFYVTAGLRNKATAQSVVAETTGLIG